MTSAENKQIKEINKKLNRFLGIALTIFGIIIYLVFENAGFKREIKTEIEGIKELFEMHINQNNKDVEEIKQALDNLYENHNDIAIKLLENGYVRNIKIRNGKVE